MVSFSPLYLNLMLGHGRQNRRIVEMGRERAVMMKEREDYWESRRAIWCS